VTATFWRTSVFLRHRPASHPGPSPPGTPAPDPAPRRHLCTEKHLRKCRAFPRRLCLSRRTTGAERRRPQTSAHGRGGSGVLYPPTTTKPGPQALAGRASLGEGKTAWIHCAQGRGSETPRTSAALTTFPLIGASAQTLIGQFPARSARGRTHSITLLAPPTEPWAQSIPPCPSPPARTSVKPPSSLMGLFSEFGVCVFITSFKWL